MLILPESSPHYRIMSIDPGSDTLGIALFDLDLTTYKALLIWAGTLSAAKSIKEDIFTIEIFGERQARLNYLARGVREHLYTFFPNTVISEAPYMGRFPQAFETLVECLYMLRQVVHEYDPSLCLETIDSPNAKKAVNAPGKRPKGITSQEYKELVRQGVLHLPNLDTGNINVHLLDEHAIDAIAVGCYKLKTISDDIL